MVATLGDKRNEAKFRAIYEQALHLAGVLDVDGWVLDVNETAQRFIGVSQERLIGKPFWETPWWSGSALRQEELRDAVQRAAAGETVRFETRHPDVNGDERLIDFSIKPVRDQSGAVFCLLPEGSDITDCRRAQEQAERERANMVALFDAAPFGVAVFDSTAHVVRANAGLERLFAAVPPEERLLQDGRINCRHDGGGSQVSECPWCSLRASLDAALHQGLPARDIQARITQRPDSAGPEWVQCNIKPVPLGGVTHALLTVYDITEHRRAEERLRLLIEQTVFAVSMVDEQGRVVEWNRGAEELSGLSRSEVLGRAYPEVLHELLPPEERSESRRRATERAVREALQTGVPSSPSPHLVEITRQDGHRVVVEEAVFPIPTPAGYRFGGISHDVTARREAEAACATSEERYRVATQLTGQLIYDYDLESGDIQWAGAVDVITGYSSTEFAAVRIEDWEEKIHPQDRRSTMASLERAINGRKPFHCEYRFRRKDGTYLYIEDSGGLVFADDGRPQRLLGAMKDITERREAERQRQLLEHQLQQATKMEAVGRLAGGVAHDFNNLLTCISGNISCVLMDLPEGHPHAELLRDIDQAANSAAELTRQLLAFSREQLIEPRLLDLNELINKLERMVRRLIGENIVFDLRLEPELSPVMGDPGQVEQILVNLAVNARDAMPDGGRLVISTANVTLAEDEARRQGPAGDYVLLSVSDTGHGLSAEAKVHLFEPFFTTKGMGRGTGLGLATTYGAVQQAGGFIEVDTAPGRGTIFSIYFPKATGRLERHTAISTAELRGGDETILVVEDDALVRGLTVRALDRYGYRILAASCASEAVQMVERQEGDIDLLLTDVVMPDTNGRQLAEQLNRRFPHMAVLFISGYTDDVIVQHGVKEEGIALLSKPFTPVSLARKVRETLDRKER